VIDNKKPLGVQAEIFESEISNEEFGSALSEMTLGLAFASELHDLGAHREAFRMSLRATMDFFKACKFPPHLLDASRHLYSGLGDLDRGSIIPALEPTLVSHRSIDTTDEWSVRACLALALEAQKRLVGSLRPAVRHIVSACPVTTNENLSRTEQQTRVENWRRSFRKGRVPEGGHRQIFATDVAQITEADAVADRTHKLAEKVNKFVGLAAMFRSRGRVLSPLT